MKRENELEEAYKNLKEQETPDLWSRIEAGIEAESVLKEEVKNDEEKVAGIEAAYIEKKNKEENGNIIYFSDRSKKKITGKQIRTMAAIAAAVVILIISIPLVSKRMDFYEHSIENAVVASPKAIEEDAISEGDDNGNAETEDAILESAEMPTDGSSDAENITGSEEQEENSVMKESKDDPFGAAIITKQPSSENVQISQKDGNEKNGMTNNVTPNPNIETKSLEQDKNLTTPDINNSEPSDTIDSMLSISLKKVSGVKASSLKKIKSSDLSPIIRTELKELLDDYSTCKFYKSRTGELYVKEKKILYLVKGVTL